MKKLLIAAFAAVSSLLFVACDSPEKIVAQFHDGVIEKDAEAIQDVIYLDKEMRAAIREDGEDIKKEMMKEIYENTHEDKDQLAEIKSYKIIGCVEDGDDRAYVFVGYKKDGKDDNGVVVERFPCEKVHGEWKIFLP